MASLAEAWLRGEEAGSCDAVTKQAGGRRPEGRSLDGAGGTGNDEKFCDALFVFVLSGVDPFVHETCAAGPRRFRGCRCAVHFLSPAHPFLEIALHTRPEDLQVMRSVLSLRRSHQQQHN